MISGGNRSLNPFNIEEMSRRIEMARKELLDKFEKAIGETTKFSMTVSNAIGEISIAEAEQGIIDFFTEQMRKRKI